MIERVRVREREREREREISRDDQIVCTSVTKLARMCD